MAIPVQCPECHKRYQAPDSMAGRRVKCKYCGVVFLIAADSRTESPDFDLAQLDELSALGTAAGGTAVGTRQAGGRAAVAASGAGAGAGSAGSVPAALEADIDSVFQADFAQQGAPRTNKLYIFPMSRLLDRWLPPLLLTIGLLWVVREAWSRNPTTQPWVGAFRAGMFLLAFFAAIYPFTLMGVRAAARRLNYELPPKTNLRVLGTFALPAALAAALWLIYQDVPGLLLGCAIGVAVALPVLFLMLRLLPREAPVTFAYAAGSFALSVVVVVGALFALNLMLVGILRSAKTEHSLTTSPFGPGFSWDGPYRAGGKAALAKADDPAGDGEAPATTGPATNESVAASGAASRPAAGPATREAGSAVVENTAPSVPTVRPNTADAGAQGTVLGGDATASAAAPRTPGSHPFLPPGFGTSGNTQTQRKKANSLVKDQRTVIKGDDITAVVRPVVPGPWLAVVRPGAVRGSDRVERWNTETWKSAGEAQLPRDPDGNAYSLSSDGELLAYISRFPSLSVQVWSFAEGRIVREVRLNTNPRADLGQPHLLGFSRPDQVVVHWRRFDRESGVEVHTLKGGGGPRQIPVEDFDSSPGTYAISPDGQNLSILWRAANSGGIATYALATGKPVRSMPINVLDWRLQVRPAGLAYTPDGAHIAAVIEGDGQGLFATWPAAGKPVRPDVKYVVPLGTGEAGEANGFSGEFQGSAFEWLDGGRALLLYGSAVFETDTGRYLGDLGVGNVHAQISTGNNTCELVRSTEGGGVEVEALTLDLSKARETANGGARAPQGTSSDQKPSTRRAGAAGRARGDGA